MQEEFASLFDGAFSNLVVKVALLGIKVLREEKMQDLIAAICVPEDAAAVIFSYLNHPKDIQIQLRMSIAQN